MLTEDEKCRLDCCQRLSAIAETLAIVRTKRGKVIGAISDIASNAIREIVKELEPPENDHALP